MEGIMAYTPYNNTFYMQDLQNMRDRIDRQMAQLQQNQVPQPQPTSLTQNFQLAPNPSNSELEAKYADNIEQVKNTFVIKTGIFATKDFSTIWIKDVTGNIKTYKTEEIVELDEKDKEILALKKEIESMKGMIANATNTTNEFDSVYDEAVADKKSAKLSNAKHGNAK